MGISNGQEIVLVQGSEGRPEYLGAEIVLAEGIEAREIAGREAIGEPDLRLARQKAEAILGRHP